MTPKDAIRKLRELQKDKDSAVAHFDADDVLCELLVALGHDDVVAAWRRIRRRYL